MKLKRLPIIGSVLGLLFLASYAFWGTLAPSKEPIDFNESIRPILSSKCYACHGPDPNSREAELRLDLPESAMQLLPSGKKAIIPGNPNSSELIRRIESHDEGQLMPPVSSNKLLTELEKYTLRQWIKEGAQWKPHWSFIEPSTTFPTDNQSLASKQIDAFIEEKVASKELPLAKKADNRTLLRRLAMVLTGLTPTVTELERFLNADSTISYANMVDYYLESPAFGERWARHWMDLVRYSETLGHEFDFPVNGAWQYRDYLIRAFNEDVPYNQLILEHLAGDLLESPRTNPSTQFNESIIGTAFYNFGEGKHSPVDIKAEESTRIDNIIDVTTKTFQALTVACAKCHDHKFDPIPTQDYYALYGIFESARPTIYPARQFVTSPVIERDTFHTLKENLATFISNKEIQNPPNPRVPYQSSMESTSTPLKIIGDFRAGGLNGWIPQGAVFFNVKDGPKSPNSQKGTSSSNGFISSKSLGQGQTGALRSPTFIIEQDSLLVRAAGISSSLRLIVENFQLIQFPIHGGLEVKLNTERPKDFIINLKPYKGFKAYLEIMNGTFAGHQYQIEANAWASIFGAYSFSKGEKQWPFKNNPLARSTIKGHSRQKINQSAIDPKLFKSEKYSNRDTSFFKGVTRGDQIESFVFNRGNHLTPTEEKVPHQFLSQIGYNYDFSPQKDSRLELATAIIDPENPLTARVLVNRVWHHLFGKGIVPSVDNFGLQGDFPTHPQLLDYLALYFMDSDWSIKDLIKAIVLTETFQRSSVPLAESKSVDPKNKFLSHYPSRRIEGEAIRDIILATAGSLKQEMYGPPIPIHLTDFTEGRGRPKSGPIDGDGRRSVYLSVRRNFLSPFMLTFDMPIPFSTFGRRNITNVPAQSLILMNNPFVLDQAVKWSQHLLTLKLSDQETIEQIYLTAFGRLPTSSEIEMATAFLNQQKINYTDLDPMSLIDQVWEDLCHSIFNTKEFIYIQ